MPGRVPLPRLQTPKAKLPFQTACPNCLAQTACSQIACLKLPGDTPSCLAVRPYPDFKCQTQSCLSKLPAPTSLPERPVFKLPASNCLVTHPVARPCALTQTSNAKSKAAFPNCLLQLPRPSWLIPKLHVSKRNLKNGMVRFIQGPIYWVDRVIFAHF